MAQVSNATLEIKIDNLSSQFTDFMRLQHEVDKGQDAMIGELSDAVAENAKGLAINTQAIAGNKEAIMETKKAITDASYLVVKVILTGIVALIIDIAVRLWT